MVLPCEGRDAWKVAKSRAKEPEEPWYLATSLKNAKSAASWYWQRGWIEQSFKDSKSRFGLAQVRIGDECRHASRVSPVVRERRGVRDG